MILNDSFNEFIFSRRLADLSTKTILAYKMFINPFICYIGSYSHLEDINQVDINRYIETLLNRPLSKATRATYIRHLKIFLKWCSENYDVSYEYKKIRVPRSPKKNVKIYSPEELQQIFDSISAESEWIVYRNKSIISLMYDSGLRQSEVCNLLWDNISFKDGMLTVIGKGNKERIVPLGSFTTSFLKKYLKLCPYNDKKYVLLDRRGEVLTNNAVKLLVTKLANKLPFELSSHKLRHNFATNYCIDHYEKYGHVDIYQLMILLGHEDVETTRRYLHHANEIVASKNHISHLDKVFS